jgi:hypothetical protein
LEDSAQVVCIAPSLQNLSAYDSMNKRCRKRLPYTLARYSHEALLRAGVRRAHDYFVALGNDIFNLPSLGDRPDGSKEFADAICAGGQRWGPSVHRPSWGDHLADLLDPVFADEIEPSASDRFVVLDRRHCCTSHSIWLAYPDAPELGRC